MKICFLWVYLSALLQDIILPCFLLAHCFISWPITSTWISGLYHPTLLTYSCSCFVLICFHPLGVFVSTLKIIKPEIICCLLGWAHTAVSAAQVTQCKCPKAILLLCLAASAKVISCLPSHNSPSVTSHTLSTIKQMKGKIQVRSDHSWLQYGEEYGFGLKLLPFSVF